MERNLQKSGLINLLALLLVGVAGFAVARYSGSLAGQVGVCFVGIAFLVAAVSWFQMRLENNERLEKLELEELAKGHAGSALFEAKDAEVFPAQRSREQFERFFVPGLTVLLCLLQGGGAYFFWRWLGHNGPVQVMKEATVALALFALFALTLFLLGKFSSSLARLEGDRLLRASSGYLLLAAYICFIVALGIVGVQAGFDKTDVYVGYGLCVLLGLVSAETVVNLVLEVYRPRVRGKVQRPLYESRLVGLLGQPEGLITTAAQALDYQFGFKVSETWFYRFLERALGWLVLLQFGALVLSTCIVFIDAGEQGLLERFGRPVESRTLLEPGAHFKWPWPIDKVYRFRTEQVQAFSVGSPPDPNVAAQNVVLWTVAHSKEENFLVANRVPVGAMGATNTVSGKRTPPVSLITGSVPIQFQITNLLAWAYHNEDSPSLLQDIASREVVRYLLGADMTELMSHGRGGAAQLLLERIQAAADKHDMGARIIMVGLQDMHPPGKVAPDYEKVVGAVQTKAAKILAARADEIRTNMLAAARALDLTNRASADRVSREVGALAQAALFTNQIPAYQSAPSVYVERAYLETFTRATANARKYIVLTTNTQDVLVFDLQEKIREDLLNLSVAPKK